MRGRALLVALLLLMVVAPSQSQEYGNVQAIHPPDNERHDNFGHAVAVDDDWLIAGAPGNEGAVYFYKIGSGWHDPQIVHGPGPTNYGWSVAIETPWAAVGHPGVNEVEIWKLEAGTWGIFQTFSGSSGQRFGESIAMDDHRLIVGAPGSDTFSALAQPGQAYVYELDGRWSLAQSIVQDEVGAERMFGASVDVDGQRLLVGAPSRYLEDQVFRGAATVFRHDGTSFKVEQYLNVDEEFDRHGQFGRIVAIDGVDAIIAGPPMLIDDIWQDGDLFFFKRTAGVWNDIHHTEHFGSAVSLEGGQALIGEVYFDDVSLWIRSGNNWWPQDVFHLDDTCCSYASEDSLAIHDGTLYIGHPDSDIWNTNGGTIWVLTDNLPPVSVPGENLEIKTVESSVQVTVDGKESYDPDGEIVRYEWVSGSQVVEAARATFELGQGNHQLYLRVTDDAGATDTAGLQVKITAPPLLAAAFTFGPDHARPDTWVHFTDRSTPGPGLITEWSWDFDQDGRTDDTHQDGRHRFTRSGDHPVTLTITDQFGTSASITHTVHVADAKPIAEAGEDVVQGAGATRTAEVTLDGSASRDAEGAIESYQWHRGGVIFSTEAKPTATFNVGVTDVTLTVRDQKGNTASDQVKVLVTPDAGNRTIGNEPPTGSWSAEDHAPKTLKLTADVADGQTEVALWNWYLPGDDASDGRDAKLTHRFAAYGPHTVTLKATDTDGATETFTAEVDVPNLDPTARFTPSGMDRVPAGAVIVFREHSSDPEDELVSWRWDFGDGQQSHRADVGHLFDTPGNHTVTLTVTDAGGAESTTVGYIQVLEADPEVLEDWDQFEALEAQERGEILFEPPAAPSDDEDPSPPGNETVDEASPRPYFKLSRDEPAELPFPWWILLLVAGAVLILTIMLARSGR